MTEQLLRIGLTVSDGVCQLESFYYCQQAMLN